jgi:hypothetical protein
MPEFNANGSGANTRADANGTLGFLAKRTGDKIKDEVIAELEDRGFVKILSVRDDSLIARLADLETQSGRDISSLSDRVDRLEAEDPSNDDLDLSVRDLEQQVSALQSAVEALQSSVTALEAAP